MVDFEMATFFDDGDEPVDHVVDMHEGARLRAVSLYRERQRSGGMPFDLLERAQTELRDHVLPTHVGSIHIVRAEHRNAVETMAAVVDG
ncbi:MAG: hypothetical protein R3D52_06925 [Xanthobacteraceae bacterium]